MVPTNHHSVSFLTTFNARLSNMWELLQHNKILIIITIHRILQIALI